MPGPFAETSIVIEFEVDSPTQFFKFEPDAPPGDRWLHRPEEFDPSSSRDEIVDRYSLPPSREYTVHVVEVPAGESMRIGSVAGSQNRSGGGDLVEALDRDSIPEAWIVDTKTLQGLLNASS